MTSELGVLIGGFVMQALVHWGVTNRWMGKITEAVSNIKEDTLEIKGDHVTKREVELLREGQVRDVEGIRKDLVREVDVIRREITELGRK